MSKKRKAVSMYICAKMCQGISWAGMLVALICCAADMRYSSLVAVLVGLLCGGAVFVIFNQIAHFITCYMYNRKMIKRAAITKSVIYR